MHIDRQFLKSIMLHLGVTGLASKSFVHSQYALMFPCACFSAVCGAVSAPR